MSTFQIALPAATARKIYGQFCDELLNRIFAERGESKQGTAVFENQCREELVKLLSEVGKKQAKKQVKKSPKISADEKAKKSKAKDIVYEELETLVDSGDTITPTVMARIEKKVQSE